MKILKYSLILLFFASCSSKEKRIFILPPSGAMIKSRTNWTYAKGKPNTKDWVKLSVPVKNPPDEVLFVDKGEEFAHQPVTLADQVFLQGESLQKDQSAQAKAEKQQLPKNEEQVFINRGGQPLPPKLTKMKTEKPKKLENTETPKIAKQDPDGFQPAKASLSYLKGIEIVQKLFKQGRYSDALLKIEPLARSYPKKVKLHLMKGTLYKKLGENNLALQSYRKAKDLGESSLVVENAINELELQKGARFE